MSRDSITARMDAALDKARAQGLPVRAIYLNAEDSKAFSAEASEAWGGPVAALSHSDVPLMSAEAVYRDVAVRVGKTSLLYTKQGVTISVPKLLSRRVAA